MGSMNESLQKGTWRGPKGDLGVSTNRREGGGDPFKVGVHPDHQGATIWYQHSGQDLGKLPSVSVREIRHTLDFWSNG